MKTTFSTMIFLLFAVLLTSCSKDNLDVKDGTYKGTFTAKYKSNVETGQTTLILKNGKFSCSGNSNRIPAGGSGTFSLNKNKITFNDENFWTADFDWGLILKGEYDYTFNGKKLKISSKANKVGHYKYKLDKQ